MPRIIFHIDVNNAFLSWSAIYLLQHGYKQDIRKIPAVIGGDESARKGIVLAKSPIAKKYGIVTAETLYSARNKCKSLQVFPPNYTFYKEQSKKLYNYLASYTPLIEQYSIDECFLDLTGTTLLYGNDYVSLAHKIKDEIKEKFGFTVNVGIGENKLCAKMASDFEKPDKVHTLYLNEIETKMWPLKVDDLFMLGKSSAKKLNELGIYTIKDLANADLNLLRRYFKSSGDYFKQAALGLDYSKVEPRNSKNKCISVSRTLPYDVVKKEDLLKILFSETEEVSFTLRTQKLYTKTIAVTYRNNLFRNYSHQITLDNETNATEEIYKQVKLIFENSWQEDPIRNIGIRLSDLKDKALSQLSLFEESDIKVEDKVEEVMDSIIKKYGKGSVIRASKKEENYNIEKR
ncbi:MAG TPA: DNA polymerase IV [Candidatus Onthousia faecavium]|nr:DNA polymerase IV [Candidatus Onthousia faecavium]